MAFVYVAASYVFVLVYATIAPVANNSIFNFCVGNVFQTMVTSYWKASDIVTKSVNRYFDLVVEKLKRTNYKFYTFDPVEKKAV